MSAPTLLTIARTLDRHWTQDYPGGPDSPDADHLAVETLALWRDCRAAIKAAFSSTSQTGDDILREALEAITRDGPDHDPEARTATFRHRVRTYEEIAQLAIDLATMPTRSAAWARPAGATWEAGMENGGENAGAFMAHITFANHAQCAAFIRAMAGRPPCDAEDYHLGALVVPKDPAKATTFIPAGASIPLIESCAVQPVFAGPPTAERFDAYLRATITAAIDSERSDDDERHDHLVNGTLDDAQKAIFRALFPANPSDDRRP